MDMSFSSALIGSSHGAAMAAGIAEALSSVFIGAAVSAALAVSGAIVLRRQRPVSLLLLAIACTLFATATWHLIDRYQRAAMGAG